MLAQNQISKAICITLLIKADVANPNAGWGEGNITVMKKVSLNDGSRHPYISGQALRRYLRDTLTDQNIISVSDMSPQSKQVDPKAPIITEGKPTKYFDDDLLGFMRATTQGTKRRESPLRVSAAFGIFPYEGDRDLGTKTMLEVTGDPEAGGAMFETEITNNIFRSTWLLELDRIGKGMNYETVDSANDLKGEGIEVKELVNNRFIYTLPMMIRKERVKSLLRSLKYYRGGARCGRLLLDLTPRFIVYFRLSKKLPLLLNDLMVEFKDREYKLKEEPIKEIVNDYKEDIHSCIVGYRKSFLSVDDNSLKAIFEVKKPDNNLYFPVIVCSVGEAIDKMIEDINRETVSF